MQERIQKLETEIVGIKHELTTNNETLKEIKTAIVQQSSILQNVVGIRKDVDELKEVFEKRKEVTDNNNKQFSDFVSKFKGGLAVGLFFFGILQGSFAYLITEYRDESKKFQQEVVTLQREMAVLKAHEAMVHKNGLDPIK